MKQDAIAVTWERLNSKKNVEEFIGMPEVLYCKGTTFDFSSSKKLQVVEQVPIDTQLISAVLLNNVNNGEWYTFTVRESNSLNGDSTIATFYSPYSAPVSGIAMPRPPYLFVNMSRGQVFTTHGMINNAEYYTIYFSPDTIIPQNARKYISHSMHDTIKGLDPDIEYQLAITYTYAGVESDCVGFVKIKPSIDLVVDSFKVSVSNDSAVVSWKTTNSALKYSIIAEYLLGGTNIYSFVVSPLVITGLKLYPLKRVSVSICYYSYCNDSTYIDIQNP